MAFDIGLKVLQKFIIIVFKMAFIANYVMLYSFHSPHNANYVVNLVFSNILQRRKTTKEEARQCKAEFTDMSHSGVNGK